jgi:hypothetical protein
MEIVITEWALNSYLDLKHKNTFKADFYKSTLRPDVLLLQNYPNEMKFSNSKFWSIATDGLGSKINDGFKMKWHQVGAGKVQLRLPVGIIGDAFLCESYVKSNEKLEKRKMAKFKTHLELIRKQIYTECGRLS